MAAAEPPMLYQGVARSSAAFRLLKQMGWQEGEGLGKERQGITEHLRVTKKKDNSGVGVDPQQERASNWTFNTAAFDSILKNLNVIVADRTQPDDTNKKETTHDLRLHESSPTPIPKRVTRPQGRYKKREIGKLLKGKSQADLDAILGYRKLTKKEVWPPASKDAESLGEKSSRLESYRLSVERLAIENDTSAVQGDLPLEEMSTLDVASDWWGTRYGFVRAGALGQLTRDCFSQKRGQEGLTESQLTKPRMSFCEQDQEALYKLVQDKATKGRQGLGIADRPNKIGGAHWKGQKVVLDTDKDEAGNEENPTIVSAISDVDEGNEIDDLNERLAKRRKLENKFRWKKLCRQLLEEAPTRTMKIKDLHKQIVELKARGDADNFSQILILSKERLKEKLMKSTKFVIDRNKVSYITSL